MKYTLLSSLAATSLLFTACDGEKSKEAVVQAKEAAHAAGAATKEAAEKAAEATKDYGAKAKEMISDAAAKTKAAAQKAGDAIKDSGVIDKAKDALHNAGDRAKDIIHNAGDKAKALGAKAKEGMAHLSEEHKGAIDGFKNKIGHFSEWLKAKQSTASSDPAAAKPVIKEMVQQLNALDSTQLPADLKAAVDNFKATYARGGQLMQALPADKLAAEKWTMDNAEALHAIEKDSQAAMETLKTTAAKYGIENLNLE